MDGFFIALIGLQQCRQANFLHAGFEFPPGVLIGREQLFPDGRSVFLIDELERPAVAVLQLVDLDVGGDSVLAVLAGERGDMSFGSSPPRGNAAPSAGSGA